MTPEQFVYWLQGYFELTDQKMGRCNGIDTTQMEIIRDHLREVFLKKTPDYHPDKVNIPYTGPYPRTGDTPFPSTITHIC